MATRIHSARLSLERLAVLRPDWGEHVVSAAAASCAILVVAAIAVLMGMA
jgi:hypothetical protein